MISKFVEPWILPVGATIVLIFVVVGLLTIVRRRLKKEYLDGCAFHPRRSDGLLRPIRILGIAIAILSVVGASIYLLSTETVARTLVRGLEESVAPVDPGALRSAQAVVVLGGGAVIGPRYDSLSPEAEARLVEGYLVARDRSIPIVVSGGRVLDTVSISSEAEIMARRLAELGMRRSDVLIEDRSRTTAENARYTRERFGFSTVIVVTSAWHLRRATLAFETVGVEALPVGAPTWSDTRPWRAYMLLPSATRLYQSATVIRERIGYLWYRIRL